VFLLCNTNVKRDLAQSHFFNERVEECKKGLEILRKNKHRENLAEYDEDNIEEILDAVTEQLLKRRVKHVLSENRRVKRAVSVLVQGDFEAFGKLLTESGRSLKEDYEVTGEHLDWMVEAASKCDGVLGARMMGAGFGGCALVFARKQAVAKIKEAVATDYRAKSGVEVDFYEYQIGDGVREIKF
jgi:galactokinase